MKPKDGKDGYSDSYFTEAEIYQIMQEGEEARSKLEKPEENTKED